VQRWPDLDTGPVKRLLAGLATVLFAACQGGGVAASPLPSPATAASAPVATAVANSPAPSEGLPTVRRIDGAYLYGGDDVVHPAGVYAAPSFALPFKAEFNAPLGIRESGQSELFVFIGQDKNAPADGDEEFDAMFLRQVLDPLDQRSLSTFDGDPFEWFLDHTRLSLVKGSETELEVDGLPARQAEFLPASTVACGSFHPNLQCVLIGFGPDGDEPFALFGGSRLRIVVVAHEDRDVVFAYQSADTEAFAAKVAVFDHWIRTVDFS
jgi:hypothetical protein